MISSSRHSIQGDGIPKPEPRHLCAEIFASNPSNPSEVSRVPVDASGHTDWNGSTSWVFAHFTRSSESVLISDHGSSGLKSNFYFGVIAAAERANFCDAIVTNCLLRCWVWNWKVNSKQGKTIGRSWCQLIDVLLIHSYDLKFDFNDEEAAGLARTFRVNQGV